MYIFSFLVASLGISSELQAKLQDVMIVRNLLSIGKVLGEGEETLWSGLVLCLSSFQTDTVYSPDIFSLR